MTIQSRPLSPQLWRRPAVVAFFASILLSLIAIRGGDGPNRDGILYLDAAQAFLDGGWSAARKLFDWPMMSAIIGVLSKLSGLSVENAAFLLSVLLTAGTCALVVILVRRYREDAAWAGCLAVLAIPGINAYRTDVFREFGFWCFLLLAIVLAQSWVRNPRWRESVGVMAAVGAAALFRLEAAALLPVLLLWMLFAQPVGQRLARAPMLFALPVLIAAAGGAVIVASGALAEGRFAYYFSAVNPEVRFAFFDSAAQRLTDAVLQNKYAADEARSILFFGMVSTIVVKFFNVLGIFVVPLWFGLARDGLVAALRRLQPGAWMMMAYSSVLCAFLFTNLFMVQRYVVLLNLLILPVVADGMISIARRWPRWRVVGMVVFILLALANVISLSPGKTQYRDAGEWLSANVQDRGSVFLEDGRVGYFAGWTGRRTLGFDRESAIAADRFEYLALDVRKSGAEVRGKLEAAGWTVVAAFRNKGGDEILMAHRQPSNPNGEGVRSAD